jgi:hypothetical protein
MIGIIGQLDWTVLVGQIESLVISTIQNFFTGLIALLQGFI